MKTYTHLYPHIYTWETLEVAYRKARKGKRGTRPGADFEYARESNLFRWQYVLPCNINMLLFANDKEILYH